MPIQVLYKKALSGAFLFLLLSLNSQAAENICAADHIDEYAHVKEIYDGDTIHLSDKRKIRFVGINTPELAKDDRAEEPLARAATDYLSSLIPPGSTIALRYDRQRKDRYRRTLAHVFREDGMNVTAEMLRQGKGFAIVVPPGDWQVKCYFLAEQQARAAARGIWAHAYYAPRAAEALASNTRGFALISGRITRIGQGKKNIWLDMGRAFSVRLQRKDLGNFGDLSLDSLKAKNVTVRGWVTYYNNKMRMSLRHPAMININE